MKRVLALALILLAACSSTGGRGHKNPDIIAYRLNTTAVRVLERSEFGVELENCIVEELRKQGVNAFPTYDIYRFARNREEVIQKLTARGTTEMLNIKILGDKSSSETFAYHSTGQATAYGDTAYGSGMSVPLKRTERVMQMAAAIITPDETKVWEADTYKWAQGALMVNDRSMMKGNVKALVKAMKKDNLF